MSGWTHSVCDTCYAGAEPGRTPIRLRIPETEVCCSCGMDTDSGIFYRADPADMPYCDHKDDE